MLRSLIFVISIFAVAAFASYILTVLAIKLLLKKPDKDDDTGTFDAEGRSPYVRTPQGYEFWFKDGKMVRMRKGDSEWALNPENGHLEPIVK